MPTATERRAEPRRSGAAKRASKSAGATNKKRLLAEPDTSGPKVRLGVLWFLVLMAAVTSGRMWISLLCAGVSAAAGQQIANVWDAAGAPGGRGNQRSQRTVPQRRGPSPSLSGLVAGTLPLLAGYGTGTVGAGLAIAPIVVVAFHTATGGSFSTARSTLVGALLPAIPAASIVLTVRTDLWVGLFLVLAVSLYDAGSFLLGAEAGSRWEGPVAGMIGVLAVTFTVAVFHPSPLTPESVAVIGVVGAFACPLGQIIASKFLPTPESTARGLRRLDAYLVSGPAFYIYASLVTR